MNRRNRILRRNIFWVGMCLLTAGCASSHLMVTPDPKTMTGPWTGSCGDVLVRELPAGKEGREYNNTLSGMVLSLERSGLFDNVYYHNQPQGDVDMVLDVQFNRTLHRNLVGETLKAVASGLSMGTLFPVVKYRYNYEMTSDMTILKNGSPDKELHVRSTAAWSGKLMAQLDLPQEIPELQESVYKQLLTELNDYCQASEKGR